MQLIIFGGKGGSGRTTYAAASALHLAQLELGKKILVVSVDPANSLGGSFNIAIGNKITPVGGAANPE